MGKPYVCLAAAFVFGACGSDHADKVIDAPPKPIDAAPDAKVYMDAPPVLVDAPPAYDFTCATNTVPTTAPATISISGTADSIGAGGATALMGVTVTGYADGSSTPLVAAVTSDGSGNWTLANVPTPAGSGATGHVPLAGFIEANVGSGSSYLTTFVYPPYPLAAANVTGVRTVMVSSAAWGELQSLASVTQGSANGALFVEVSDCAGSAITGSTLNVTQGGSAIAGATIFNVGQLDASYGGIFLVLNVPAGSANLTATYGTHTLPATGSVSVVAYKEGQMGVTVAGALTATLVRPGPN